MCGIKQIFMGDSMKFCGIFTENTLKLPRNSQRSLFKCKKLVTNTTKCVLCLFLHKMCCKMVSVRYGMYDNFYMSHSMTMYG